ncbi:MAG: hypothetical protein ACI86M_002000 [Saprospiraceae bacterium]
MSHRIYDHNSGILLDHNIVDDTDSLVYEVGVSYNAKKLLYDVNYSYYRNRVDGAEGDMYVVLKKIYNR